MTDSTITRRTYPGALVGGAAPAGPRAAAFSPFFSENAGQWRRIADLLDTAYQLALLGQHSVAMEAVHAAQVAADMHAAQYERAAREMVGTAG
jgi:hypothetical protein